MLIRVTGDVRQVAESAWISTLSEIKAQARSDDDARKVVEFLIDNHHTSPFEAITLTFEEDHKKWPTIEHTPLGAYAEDRFCRIKPRSDGATRLSIDLLNFVKVTMNNDLFNRDPWILFEEVRPELATVCQRYNSLGDKSLTKRASEQLGEHGMKVELVSFHDEDDLELSRATWRICCPLSIAVQILRHRSGSFNMTSGRYRTLRQDIISPVDDCAYLFDMIGMDLNRYLGSVDGTILQYNKAMRLASEAKEKKIISNPEYKRIREFARFILPEGRMTELYVTFYLNDFYNNYVVLRDSEHTQVEHIWVVQEMEKTLKAQMEK